MVGLLSMWRNWRDRREVLNDLSRQQANDREWATFRVRDDLTDAVSALLRGDRRHGSELWDRAINRYPNEARDSPLALKVLLGLRRFDEAEVLMQAGQRAHPGWPVFVQGLADIAAARGDHLTAVTRWAAYRRQFPGDPTGFVFGVMALRESNQPDEAETLAQLAIRRFPDKVGCFLEYAKVSELRKDWILALERWEIVRTRFGHPAGVVSGAEILIKLGRFNEAEELLVPVRIRFPTEASIDLALARCANARQDIPLAIKRWKSFVHRFPLDMKGCLASAAALEELGAVSEAETVLREVANHFPSEYPPLVDLANLLRRGGKSADEVDAWANLRRAFPDMKDGYTRGAEALIRAGHPEQAEDLKNEYRARIGT